MSVEFYAEPNPSEELCAEISALAPSNPFYTAKYIEARRLLGFQPWALVLLEDGRIETGCTAFIKSGRLSRCLEVTSLPKVSNSDVFWEGILDFCRDRRVSHLQIDSFSSVRAEIPSLRGETSRRARFEYILELQKPDLWNKVSSNHARNIKRGRKAGLQVQRSKDEQACQEHARLVAASMGRRQSRGESVPEDSPLHSFLAFSQTGAGEFFEALLDGEVFSSVMVMIAEKGGYYQSAGTSKDGMAVGASPFLLHEIAGILQEESMDVFNLGGADPSSQGLVRFKTGFGTEKVELEAAGFYLGSRIRNNLGTFTQFVKERQKLARNWLEARR